MVVRVEAIGLKVCIIKGRYDIVNEILDSAKAQGCASRDRQALHLGGARLLY